MEYEKACSQINFIMENLEQSERDKIPNKVKEFFFFHKDPLYKVNLDVNKNLYNQDLLIETKAFLYIIKYKYLSTEAEKEKLEQLLNIEEKEVDMDSTITIPTVHEDEKKENQLVVVKENKIQKFFKFIFEKLFARKN